MPEVVDEMVKAILDTIAGNLRIQLGGSSVINPGQTIAPSITPFPQSIPTIKLVESPFSLNGHLDPATVNGSDDRITHISKKVQFKNPLPESSLANSDLNQRIESVATPIILPTSGFANVAGFSGLLDQISIPHLVGDLSGWLKIPMPIQVPITAHIAWEIVELIKEQPEETKPLTPGVDYLAPHGLDTFTPTFIIRPPIVTDPAQAQPVMRYLRATLTLSADTYTTEPIPLPKVGIRVLPLLLPLSLLFRLSLDNVPEPGLPTNISLVRTVEQAPNIPDIFELVWDTLSANPTKIPLPLTVEWQLLKDENGQKVPLQSERITKLSDLPKPPFSILIQPNIVEMAEGRPPLDLILPDIIYVRARIGLAGTPSERLIALPEIPLPVPTIPIPTLLALFNHSGFSLNTYGKVPPCVVVVVPTNSLLRTANVEELLNALRGLLTTIGQLSKMPVKLPIVSKLVGALGPVEKLVNTLAALAAIAVPGETKGPKLVLRSVDAEDELGDIRFYTDVLNEPLGGTANDSLGSLIFIGPPGKSVRFYNDVDFKEGQGAFNLRLPGGELMSFAALIESLHGDPPATFPEAAYIGQRPAEDDTFGDTLSSFKFLPPDWINVTIESFEPTSGAPGTEVVVDIEGYIETLELNGTLVEYTLDLSNLLDLKVRFTVPEGATSGPIKAKFRDLEAVTEQPFTVTAA